MGAGGPEGHDVPGLVTVLFSDIVGSTEFVARRGDDVARAIRTRHDQLVRQQIRAYDGREVQTTGDGFLIVFSSVRKAVGCASAIQLAQARYNDGYPDEALSIRVGLNAGEVSWRDDGLFGAAVNLAARVTAKAGPGEILVSEVVKQLAGGLLDVEFRDRGRFRLRGFPGRWRLYQVIWNRTLAPATSEQPAVSRTVRPKVPTNLPRDLTPFIGRHRQLAALRSRLVRERLISLVGPAGTGKTRLALAVAAATHSRFKDGVWFIELAPLTGSERLPRLIAETLGIKENGQAAAIPQLIAEVGHRRVLLILDNCEHVLDHAAPLCDRLLRSCPHLTILVTSRERLGVAAELVWQVPPMELPDSEQLHLPSLARTEAVQLFLERGRRARPSLTVDEENAAAIANLVRRLEGLPLAIELAAAWSGILSPSELLSHLGDRFQLLTGRDRVGTPRHASLRAAIDWSYDSLEPTEQRVFQSLGLFAGGFSLESMSAVCELKVTHGLVALGRLIDRSLVFATEQSVEQTRYRMLESVREYAVERLTSSPEFDSTRQAFVSYFCDFAEQSGDHVVESPGGRSLVALDVEHDNWFLAFNIALEIDSTSAIRLAAALGPYWALRGHYREARLMLAAAISSCSRPSSALMTALRHQAHVAWAEGNQRQAIRHSRRSLVVSLRLGDAAATVLARQQLAQIQFEVGNLGEARSCLEKALASARGLGDQRLVGLCLFRLGTIALVERQWPVAHDLLSKSIQLAGAADDVEQQAIALVSLGVLHLNMGDPEAARTALKESLAMWKQRASPRQLVVTLQALGAVALAEGDAERAARLVGAAAGIREAAGVRMTSPLQQELDALVQPVADDATLAGRLMEGRGMERRMVVEYALG